MNPAGPALSEITMWQSRAFVIGAVLAAVSILGLVFDREQFLRSYLVAYVFWVSMALGCLAILMMHHVVGGKWGAPIRPMCEAGARTLPWLGLALIPVLVGIVTLYPWARPEAAADLNLQRKAAYLNVPFFIGRAALCFVIWTYYASRLSKLSLELGRTGEIQIRERLRSISAPGLVVLMLTVSFAFIDWVMSLEPHWFSTIYAAMFIIGQTLEAFAFTIGMLILLSRFQSIQERVTAQHFHDLGNMMFAFMVLWAYLSFSQYLIIWSGNLPSEISWYVKRLQGTWNLVAISLVVFHFALPFALLLGRGIKRNPSRLLPVCALLLFMRWVDVYWLTAPAFGSVSRMRWLDAVLPLAMGGFWVGAFLGQLKGRPLVASGDPRLEGAPRETVAF